MSWLYIDTSTLVRLSGVERPGHPSLTTLVDGYLDNGGRLVSSEILRLEVRRVAVRIINSGHDASALLASLAAVTDLRAFDSEVRTRAWAITQTIKTLDSIHVATCALLRDEGLDIAMATSDLTMRSVAQALGLAVQFVPVPR